MPTAPDTDTADDSRSIYLPGFIYNGRTYTDVIAKGYEYDLETEDLIYSDDLVDGMLVLSGPEDMAHAAFLAYEPAADATKTQLVVLNRWCRVSKLRVEGSVVHFIGIYEDGRKHMRCAPTTGSWIVKIDSVPTISPKVVELRPAGWPFEG